jgi:hypothetical protein
MTELEGDEAFKDGLLAAHGRVGGCEVCESVDFGLALAVVAEAAGFEDRWQTKFLDVCLEVGEALDAREFGGFGAEVAGELLFVEAVLGGCQRFDAGADGEVAGKEFDSREGDVFEFISGDKNGFGEPCQGRFIVIGRDGGCRCDVERGAGTIGIDVALEAEAGRCHGQHAAELTRAKDADAGAWLKREIGCGHGPVLRGRTACAQQLSRLRAHHVAVRLSVGRRGRRWFVRRAWRQA